MQERSAVQSLHVLRLLIDCLASVGFLPASTNAKQSHLAPFWNDKLLDLA